VFKTPVLRPQSDELICVSISLSPLLSLVNTSPKFWISSPAAVCYCLLAASTGLGLWRDIISPLFSADFHLVCTFHDGCRQGIDQQIFNRKSISRKITHPHSWKLQAKLTGEKWKGWSNSREKTNSRLQLKFRNTSSKIITS